MTRQEFAMLSASIKTYYPHSRVLESQEAMELWYAELKDADYRLASEAVREHARTEKWPPTIAEILNGVKSTKEKLYFDALEKKLLYGTTEIEDRIIERHLIEQRGKV